MVHEEHLRGTGRLPINEYKSRLSVARERGPLIRRFYDGTGNAVRYYNLENIPVAPPFSMARGDVFVYTRGFRRKSSDIPCKFHWAIYKYIQNDPLRNA